MNKPDEITSNSSVAPPVKPGSKRFTRLGWRERLVPLVLVLLLVALLATLLIVILAVLGLMPGA